MMTREAAPARARLLSDDPDAYHLRPGLSQSYAHTLLTKSPKHAWQEHPFFGAGGKAPTKSMDRGGSVHQMVLGKGKDVACLPYDDWRTKASQESRDKCRAAGIIPRTHIEHSEDEKIAAAIKARLSEMGIHLVGGSEVGIEWWEDSAHGTVLCRGMMDHFIVSLSKAQIYDLKVVHNANPEHTERSAENYGYAIQAAAYRRAVRFLHPHLAGRISFRFLFAESEPPYAMYCPEPSGEFEEIGERRWLRAVEEWSRCLATGYWPDYQDHRVIYPPGWALAREGYTTEER